MEPFDPATVLAEEKARAEKSLASVYADFTPTDGIGFGKRVGDGTHIAVERITEVGKQEALLTKLALIEAAQERVAAGNYGLCTVCGEAIGEARLEALPATPTCIRHA